MVQPERHIVGEYRYAFNGMEKDDEIKGTNNSYDFGARMYDGRVGRWLSRDPLEAKYPNHSPYHYAVNSPLLFKDPNGEDAVVTISKDGTEVKYSSTIYIVGNEGDREYIRELQNLYNHHFADVVYEGRDKDGKPVDLVIEMNFVFVERTESTVPDNIEHYRRTLDPNGDPKKYKLIGTEANPNEDTPGLKYGENLVVVGFDFAANSANPDQSQAVIASSTKNKAFATLHEVLHLYGLSDRYDFDGKDIKPHEGHEGTFMGGDDVDDDGFSTDFHQNNINAMIQAVFEIYGNSEYKVTTRNGEEAYSIYKEISGEKKIDDRDQSKKPANIEIE